MTTRALPLVVTAGEPAGIGPDLCVQIAARGGLDNVVVIGDRALLERRARRLGVPFDLEVRDLPFPAGVRCGSPDPANANTLLEGLQLAVEGCRDGRYAGLVTAPLAKHVISAAGLTFTGHTEYLADLCAVSRPVMLLVAGELRVALASTHLPLRDVPDFLSRDVICESLEVLHDGLRKSFGIEQPEIVVCGLNPHAGENGLLGREDDEIIRPVVDELAGRGMRVRGPLPADTAFTPAAGHHDAVLAMYHDQGLPVLKYAGFGRAVNVTLGLPIVRTSVDHGTAFDLAGTGSADTGSFEAAITLARALSTP